MPRSRFRVGLEMLLICLVLSTARASFADHYVVPSGSMRPSVEVGDHVCVSKAAYGLRVPFSEEWVVRFSEPKRNDVVVLQSPENADVLLKRVVAVAGEDVRVREGSVAINGVTQPEPQVRLTAGPGPDFGPTVVPRDHLLVMGDNRGDSHDGRSFGFVHRDALLGRVLSVCVRESAPTWQPL